MFCGTPEAISDTQRVTLLEAFANNWDVFLHPLKHSLQCCFVAPDVFSSIGNVATLLKPFLAFIQGTLRHP